MKIGRNVKSKSKYNVVSVLGNSAWLMEIKIPMPMVLPKIMNKNPAIQCHQLERSLALGKK